jgi:hypothetical protein
VKLLRNFVLACRWLNTIRPMASYHCSVKAGASSSAGAHDDYIEREGKYKTKDRADLEHKESGNLPIWAESSSAFWKASDEHERVNAAGYREYEIALPRELTEAQRLELVREFVRQELGDRHAYTFAIHNPRAALEGGEQPHAHIMFSERLNDGIDRKTPEHYFKQANGKDRSRGGCKKANSARKTHEERKADLVDLRARWAALQNRHLEKHGHADRVDHRTLKDQGIDRLPTEHLGPTSVAMAQKAMPTRRGAKHAQRLADINDLSQIAPIERQLDADRRELDAIVKDETPKPNETMAAFLKVWNAKQKEVIEDMAKEDIKLDAIQKALDAKTAKAWQVFRDLKPPRLLSLSSTKKQYEEARANVTSCEQAAAAARKTRENTENYGGRSFEETLKADALKRLERDRPDLLEQINQARKNPGLVERARRASLASLPAKATKVPRQTPSPGRGPRV